MANKSLTVDFTADTTSLRVQSAVAKAELNAVSAEIRALAKTAVGASDEIRESLDAQMLVLQKRADDTTEHLAKLKEAINETGKAQMTGFSGIIAGLGEIGEKAEGLTSKFNAMTGAFTAIGEVVAVGFGAEYIGEQINKVAELGESYAQLSEKTGATTKQLAGLRLAAMETGTDFDTVGNGLRSLGTKMQDAITDPAGKAAEAFKAAQVSITDSSGQLLPVVDVFSQISIAMEKYSDDTAKTVLAGDMLGAKFGSSLIPVMGKVGDGFDDLQNKAQAYGMVLSGADIADSEAFLEAQKDLSAAFAKLRDEIVLGNLPAFTALEQEFTLASQDGGILSDAAVLLDMTLREVGEVVIAVVTAFSEFDAGLNFTGRVMGDVILVADALAHALVGDFGFAKAAVKVATSDIAQSWTDMLSKISMQEKLFDRTDTELWTERPDLPAATTMTSLEKHQGSSDQPAPQLADNKPARAGGSSGASAAKDDQAQVTQIASDGAEARKQIQASEYQAQVSNWDVEVAQGKITKAQEIQDEEAAQQQIYIAELQALQAQVALDKEGTAAKAKALDDIAVLTAQHTADMAKMNTDLVNQQIADSKALADAQKAAAAATSQAWQNAFAPISQAADESIKGIIQGTETLRQAEVKAAQSVTLAFVDAETKKLVSFVAAEAEILAKHVATELAITSATIAGNTARLAAKTTGDATGKAMDAATGTVTINNDAYKAAAGAYSAVVGIPYVGPVLAPVAAAAAYAGVMAFDVLSAEGGMVIPAGVSPLVQLHEKEMVLPSYIAQPMMGLIQGGSFGGDGGTSSVTNNVHLNAHGRKGSDPHEIMSIINDQFRSGAFQRYPALARGFRRGS